MVGIAASATARAASALARCTREGWCGVAPSGIVHSEVLGAGALGGAQQPPGGEPVELLDRRAGLVALGAGEVDDGPHAAQRVAERGRVGEVADGELHVHPLGPEPPRDRAPGSAPARRAPTSRRSTAEPSRPVAPVSRITRARA